MFHLLRILTIITMIITIQPARCIRGNKIFFLQETDGNAVATMYKELSCGQSSVLFHLTVKSVSQKH